MTTRTIKLVTLSAVASLAIAGSAQAKHGADDPANHNAGDDSALHVRQGADDPANHDANDDRVNRVRKARHKHRRHHGHHHRRHHARHGADDPAGHR